MNWQELPDLPRVFTASSFVVRKKIFKLVGGAFHVYDAQGELIGYSKMKAFKIRENLRLFTDEEMQTELLTIQARHVIDFSAAYDVIDPPTGQPIGVLKRRGLKSLLRDEWIVAGPGDEPFATLREDNLMLALIRRFVLKILPQNYSLTEDASERALCHFSQNFNPFVTKINVDFSVDPERTLDPRLGIAAALLLCAIEGRQD